MKDLLPSPLMVAIAAALIVLSGCTRSAQSPRMLELNGNLQAHDPVIAREADTYYVFTTGGRPGRGLIPIKCSKDMVNWSACGYVFESLPEWVPIEIPGTRGLWAPDISYFNGQYHLYYSVSTFGRNNSAIGLVTNKTLDPNSPAYQWIDHGLVVRSTAGESDFNAIDANIAVDGKNVWLCWGSFWGGIKMRQIDPATGKLLDTNTTLYSLCSRPRGAEPQTPPIEGAVEAPFLFKHDGFWYLFASFDFCCRGAKSNYNIVVGRSKNITGPYVDRAGKPMLQGGGTVILASTAGMWRGPGHCAVLADKGTNYLVFHAYHGVTGRSELKISTLAWDKGWPIAAQFPPEQIPQENAAARSQ
ncbi:MAG: arabinan endo-1,5-alpha-L-arabinosidase [Planctomycetaceae bacterium]|nr:arabinan endo-1,5-alpha-L-arabinosidase [Planctomycetaceae bacterium]